MYVTWNAISGPASKNIINRSKVLPWFFLRRWSVMKQNIEIVRNESSNKNSY